MKGAEPDLPLDHYTQQERPDMPFTNERPRTLIVSEKAGKTDIALITPDMVFLFSLRIIACAGGSPAFGAIYAYRGSVFGCEA